MEKEIHLRSCDEVIQRMADKHHISYAIVKAILEEWIATEYEGVTNRKLDD